MAAWEPPRDRVNDGEVVGRRIFEDPIFCGKLSQGRPFKLRVDHFFDTDLNADLSVDRLGRTGNCEKGPVRDTGKLAADEAARRLKRITFLGWGVIRVKTLRKSQVLKGVSDVEPRPVDEEPKNPYHAEITRDNFREKAHAYGLAHILLELAEKELGFHAHEPTFPTRQDTADLRKEKAQPQPAPSPSQKLEVSSEPQTALPEPMPPRPGLVRRLVQLITHLVSRGT